MLRSNYFLWLSLQARNKAATEGVLLEACIQDWSVVQYLMQQIAFQF